MTWQTIYVWRLCFLATVYVPGPKLEFEMQETTVGNLLDGIVAAVPGRA